MKFVSNGMRRERKGEEIKENPENYRTSPSGRLQGLGLSCSVQQCNRQEGEKERKERERRETERDRETGRESSICEAKSQ